MKIHTVCLYYLFNAMYFSQAIWKDKAKAVDALLKNGAKIDDWIKSRASGTKYEKILSDEALKRVGISD